ncbi:hypothetical protein, partial [Ornithinimicrobium faecis]|uniref:hypothetical protein n=1 Tax=Ornithinimicrobium faecis TaxID=2934158 RepID=UPI0021196201
MDTKVVQGRIRESLRRPPVVRARSSRPAGRKDAAAAAESTGASRVATDFTDDSGVPAELWVTSFDDLIAPAAKPTSEEPTGQDSSGQERASDTVTRLSSVLAELGLDAPMVESLADLAQACATVSSVDEQPSVIARGQAL